MSPAIVNAGLEAAVSLASPNAMGLVTVAIVGTTATITLELEPAGVWQLSAWLSDSATSGELTAVAPDASGTRQWIDVLTDENGQRVFTIQHVGAVRGWYFCWSLGGGYVNTHEDEIQVGV